MPATRTRRAAFLLNLPSRVFAATTSCSAILPLLHFRACRCSHLSPELQFARRLTKQRADAGLHMNTLDRGSQQPGDGEHFNLSLPLQLLRVFAQRDGVG